MPSNKNSKNIALYLQEQHPFHLVNPSLWPFVVSCSVFSVVLGLIFILHLDKNTSTFSLNQGPVFMAIGFGALIYTIYRWFKDVVTEVTTEEHPTVKVQQGLRYGVICTLVPAEPIFGKIELDTGLILTLFIAICLIFCLSYYVGYKFLSTKEPFSRKFVSLGIIGVWANAAFLHVTTSLFIAWPYSTPLPLLFFALIFLLFSCSLVASKSFRAKTVRSYEAVVASYLDLVEKTVELIFDKDLLLVQNAAQVACYFLIGSGVTVIALLCWQQPLYFLLLLCTSSSLLLLDSIYAKHWTGTPRTAEYYRYRLFMTLLTYTLGFSLYLGLLVPLATSYFAIMFLAWLEGYQSCASQWQAYKESYVKALPEINQLPPITRSKAKVTGIGVLLLPAYNTKFFDTLAFFFGGAIVGKSIFLACAWAQKNPAIPFTLANTTLLYCGLHLAVLSLFLNLKYQSKLYRNEKRRQDSVFTILINLLGKSTVYGMVGNPTSKIAEGGGIQNTIKGAAVVVGTYLGIEAIDMAKTQQAHWNNYKMTHDMQEQRHKHDMELATHKAELDRETYRSNQKFDTSARTGVQPWTQKAFFEGFKNLYGPNTPTVPNNSSTTVSNNSSTIAPK